MKLLKNKGIFLAVLTSLLLLAASAFGIEPNKDGWYFTGQAVREKKILIVSVDVYKIQHFAKQLPAKNKRAAIDLAADKRFVLTMVRDVPVEKLRDALKDAYAMNGYGDQGKIGKFLGAFQGVGDELKEGTRAFISYDAAKKTTTLSALGKTVTVEGEDFMKATWSIWFGKIDQPEIGDKLLKNL